jgi:hypothetical protein
MSRTPEEIKEMMKEVVKALDEADIPEDLRVTAFEKGFDALMGTPPTTATTAPSVVQESGRQIDRAVPADGPSLEAIASRLGLDLELVGEIYYVDGESLGLAVASSKFHPKKAAATQQIALLVAAGRQAGGWDEWTHASRIRDVARDYGRFDPANFATTIKRMGNVFSFRGRARSVEVRLTRPGYEQAANLMRELGGA